VPNAREGFALIQRKMLTCHLHDKCRAASNHFDDRPPNVGFLGRSYRGMVIVGGNPGIPTSAAHRRNDCKAYRLSGRYAKTGSMEDFEVLMDHMSEIMRCWKNNLCNDFFRDHLDYDIDEVAYLNLLKCRTAKTGSDPGRLVGAKISRRCAKKYALKELSLLRPRFIACQWKPLPGHLESLGFDLDGVEWACYSGARNLTYEDRATELVPLFEAFKRDAGEPI